MKIRFTIIPGQVLFLILALFLTPQAMAGDWQSLQDAAIKAYQDGNHIQAETAARQALAVAETASNGKLRQASSLNILAFIQSAQGDINAALASIDTAVKLSKAALKSPDEETAALLFNQGLLAQQASRTDAAQAALNESIDSYLALNSTGKGNLWQAVLVQAQILGITSPDQALARLNEAMAGFPGQADFSQQPGEVAYADLAFLAGRLYFEQQRFDQAVTILEQALQHLTTTDQQQPLLDVLGLLASSYDRTEQAEQATIVRSRILRLQAQRPATMNSVMHLNELAMRHQHDQEYALAAQYYQQALTRLSELGQEESIEQALILGNFAGVRLAEEDNQSALMLFEKSYALHKRLDQRRIEAAAVAGYIGTLYYRLRQYHNAEPVFLQALAWLDDTPEAGPESLLIALENLVALYKVWGRDSQARRFELRARELKDQRNH